MEKGYFIRAIVKDPLLHTGASTEVTSEFKHSNHPTPQKFIFSILYHLGEGIESDWIVSASTAWHEQYSLNTSKCRLLFQTLLMRRNNCSVGYWRVVETIVLLLSWKYTKIRVYKPDTLPHTLALFLALFYSLQINVSMKRSWFVLVLRWEAAALSVFPQLQGSISAFKTQVRYLCLFCSQCTVSFCSGLLLEYVTEAKLFIIILF